MRMKPEVGFQISKPEVERPLGSDSEAEGGLCQRSPAVADSGVAVLGIANGVPASLA